jgi:hypothetical protein
VRREQVQHGALGLALLEQLGGAPVAGGAPGEADVGVDGGAEQRVGEAQGVRGVEHACGHQRIGGGPAGGLVELGERAGVDEVGLPAEDGDRLGQRDGRGAEPGQPQQHAALHRGRAGGADALDARLRLGGEVVEQRAEQERVAAAGLVAGAAQLLAGAGERGAHGLM